MFLFILHFFLSRFEFHLEQRLFLIHFRFLPRVFAITREVFLQDTEQAGNHFPKHILVCKDESDLGDKTGTRKRSGIIWEQDGWERETGETNKPAFQQHTVTTPATF